MMANEPTISEKNEVIALFDGYNVMQGWSEPPNKFYIKNGEDHGVRYNSFKYHTSWDWLMPVIEKISKIPLLNHDNTPCADPQDTCYPRTFGMPTTNGTHVMFRFNDFRTHTADTVIKAAHQAVYEIAKSELDNQQKQKDGTEKK